MRKVDWVVVWGFSLGCEKMLAAMSLVTNGRRNKKDQGDLGWGKCASDLIHKVIKSQSGEKSIVLSCCTK